MLLLCFFHVDYDRYTQGDQTANLDLAQTNGFHFLTLQKKKYTQNYEREVKMKIYA